MLNDLFAGAQDNQFRMVRFQLFNWGTFSGLHDIAISPEGHLFIGGSGSGKSTLLDAMSVLLTPPSQTNFNAAAREGERRSDRTVVSYMRGAWTTQQDEEGRSVIQFLRKGSTWSALALTFKNAHRTITLMFIGIIRGNSNEDTKVTRYYYVVSRDLDICQLSEFSELNYKWEFIRKQVPDAKVFPRFTPYCECFRKEFGIEEETVLKLLHKAQSARNLGDLNHFLRKFMLDVPRTFKVADLLVDEFSALYEAHDSVVKARLQQGVLRRAKTCYEAVLDARKQKAEIDAQQESLEAWYQIERLALMDEQLPLLQDKETKARSRYEDCAQKSEEKKRKIDELTRRYYENGGDSLIRLNAELDQAVRAYKQGQAAREKFESAVTTAHEPLPENREQFNRLCAHLRTRMENAGDEIAAVTQEYNAMVYEKENKSVEFRAMVDEIHSMQKSPSNIPGFLQSIRSDAAQALGLREEELPFVGELIEVCDDQKSWQGAIERVLHNFAVSLLVDESHYMKLAQWINEHHLGARLVYQRVCAVNTVKNSSSETILPAKLNVKDCRWGNWIKKELCERFSYECVRSAQDFSRFEKAVTLAGQVKHNRSRHEKDDRRAVHDRTHWVLGFSNVEKLKLYQERAANIASTISADEEKIHQLSDKRDRILKGLEAARHILQYQYEEIDTAALASEVARLTRERDGAVGKDKALETIKEQLQSAKDELTALEHEKEKLYSLSSEASRALEDMATEHKRSEDALQALTVDNERIVALKARAQVKSEKRTLKSLPSLREFLVTSLAREGAEKVELAAQNLAQTLSCFHEYKLSWPDGVLELDESEASAPEYFEKLEQLESEGLPQFEARFKDLLNNQTRQNLSDLYREIEDERRSIKLRLEEVNKSLSQVAFNRSVNGQTHLKITVSDKNLQEVLEFKKMQSAIMSIDMDEMDNEAAERYFKGINDLVRRLDVNNREAASLRWREKVLDVREHVEFHGIEYEMADGAERVVEVYQSGAGKSGGQRQKLTVICLAAALRYQLGGRETDYPSYASVVLDEAFDKADSEFTDIALKIFKDFHFQMIIATPEKSVMTLDPYVGGTTFVSCKNRNASSVINVVYDSKTGEFHQKE